ncbi:MAG: hypothetical protein LBC68_03760, partial [Prevotellaceae bacterium]|nr:hypothetical protein [Prevotellaceae bacterium]
FGISTNSYQLDTSRTFFVPANFNGKLSHFIHSKEWNKIKKIVYTNGDNFGGIPFFFIHIDDVNGRAFEFMSNFLFADRWTGSVGRKDTFIFDCINPDFDNSFIINGNSDIYLTFYY